MLEEERKYEVGRLFTLPDLAGCVPDGGRIVERQPASLRATYYDTADLRLARAGVSLRYRSGESAEPWTVKLPTGEQTVRHEITAPGPATTVPDRLTALVTAFSRGAPLLPAATMRSVRHAYELRDADGTVLAELVDDTVSVLDGQRTTNSFRELEVERKGGTRKLLDRVEAVLTAAGATAGEFVPKHIRALGDRARQPADLPAPPAHRPDATAADLITAALRDGAARLIGADPLVRLDAELPDDTPVHQMRVGCRRLRADLRTFGPLLAGDWAAPLRTELKWLGTVLGGGRDAEVLRARLAAVSAPATGGSPELARLDRAALDRLDAVLVKRQSAALATLDETLRGARYARLLDSLVDAAREPALTPEATRPAADVLPALVAKPWRTLVKDVHRLTVDRPDADWHAVRIRAKRARYAAEAVAAVAGRPAKKLGKALAGVQDCLGEHQDAVVAAQTWLDLAATTRSGGALAVTVGRLVEREHARTAMARAEFAVAWRRATKRGKTEWLPV